LENMCLLCSRCHHKVHDQDWTVHQTPTGKYTLRRPSITDWRRPTRQTNHHHPRRRRRRRTRKRPIKQRK